MKKIGLLCLALVLALGALGVGAALWFGWLYIDGTVETGSVGAQWSLGSFYDDEMKPEVSSVEAYIAGDTLHVDILNAYPCVTYTVEWDIECTGTVPIHFLMDPISTNLPPGTEFIFEAGGVPIEQVQLHPGDMILGMLTVHLANDAEQNASYWFEIAIEYFQYNEMP
ncbi:MAG TPA: hypothetical protein VMW50_02610 [Dehalococcoidia bacterium]|nr:hypothetical protein [Dehalococcoidia bacterium]